MLFDVDGQVHLAVTPADDPAADLNRNHGRFLYFAPDEVRAVSEQGRTRPSNRREGNDDHEAGQGGAAGGGYRCDRAVGTGYQAVPGTTRDVPAAARTLAFHPHRQGRTMETLFGFVAGYIAGCKDGQDGVKRLRATAAAIMKSDEVEAARGRGDELCRGGGAAGRVRPELCRERSGRSPTCWCIARLRSARPAQPDRRCASAGGDGYARRGGSGPGRSS